MKKFMYITDIQGRSILINIDMIIYVDRDSRFIKMLDGNCFSVKPNELKDILTELEVITK